MNGVILPSACPGCPFGEIRRNMVHCRHYNCSTLIDYDRRPEYCRVKRISIEEFD